MTSFFEQVYRCRSSYSLPAKFVRVSLTVTRDNLHSELFIELVFSLGNFCFEIFRFDLSLK